MQTGGPVLASPGAYTPTQGLYSDRGACSAPAEGQARKPRGLCCKRLDLPQNFAFFFNKDSSRENDLICALCGQNKCFKMPSASSGSDSDDAGTKRKYSDPGVKAEYARWVMQQPRGANGKLPGATRAQVAHWAVAAWNSNSPETIRNCFHSSGLSLAVDGSEDLQYCRRTFGASWRTDLTEQRAAWEAEHPDVDLGPLELPDSDDEVPPADQQRASDSDSDDDVLYLEAGTVRAGSNNINPDVVELADDSESE